MGDIATGRRNVAGALVTAHQTGEIGAEIRYLSAIGTGYEWNRDYAQAVSYFNEVFDFAKVHPDSAYPFLTAAGEIETLVKQRDCRRVALRLGTPLPNPLEQKRCPFRHRHHF